MISDPVTVVVGSSSAGLALARALVGAGRKVTILEPDPHAAERVQSFLGRALGSDEELNVTDNWSVLQNGDIVIEALDDAPELVERFARELSADATLVLTTPGLVQAFEKSCADPGRILGMSLAQPAHLRRLVEVTPMATTRPGAVKAAIDLIHSMKRSPFVGKAGFPSATTRLLMRCLDTADLMLLHGSVPDEIDDAMVAFGYDLGLYRAQDWAGLTVAYAERRRRRKEQKRPLSYDVPIADRMVETGRLGRMIGVGWYRYPGGGGAVIDPIVEDLIREEARFEKVTETSFDEEAIQTRLHLCLVHEGLAMLAEGALTSASDVDLLAVEGLGFPETQGGPIALCDEIGLCKVREMFEELRNADPESWSVPAALVTCIDNGQRLSEKTRSTSPAASHPQN